MRGVRLTKLHTGRSGPFLDQGRLKADHHKRKTDSGGAEETRGAGAERGVYGDGWGGRRGLATGERKKRVGKGIGGGDAELRFLGKARAHDFVESGGDGRIAVRRRQRGRGENVVADVGDRITVKGINAG